MKIKKIEHIGIAVKNLDSSIELYQSIFGLKCYGIEVIKDQQVKVAFFKIGDVKIELLESLDTNGPIASHISKHGEGLHHIAYNVENVNETLNELKTKGVRLIDKSERIGAEGLAIAFLNPKSTYGTLTELCSAHHNS